MNISSHKKTTEILQGDLNSKSPTKEVQNQNFLNPQSTRADNNFNLIKLCDREQTILDSSEVVIIGYVEFGEELEIYQKTF